MTKNDINKYRLIHLLLKSIVMIGVSFISKAKASSLNNPKYNYSLDLLNQSNCNATYH